MDRSRLAVGIKLRTFFFTFDELLNKKAFDRFEFKQLLFDLLLVHQQSID